MLAKPFYVRTFEAPLYEVLGCVQVHFVLRAPSVEHVVVREGLVGPDPGLAIETDYE